MNELNKATQSLGGIEAVLLDIEGTICPITFVKETLFPYALQGLPKVLSEKWDSEEFQPYRSAFPQDVQQSPEAFEAHVRDLTKRDVKIAYLKDLQGYLWEEGYESGAYSTPLFTDVVPRLRKWHESSIEISVYSSGSVFAQKLLFAHVKDETKTHEDSKATMDLRYLVKDWFDTTNAGPKTDIASYRTIAEKLGKAVDKVLFLSDNVNEVRAAIEAEMQSIAVDRPGNAPLSNEDRDTFRVITSFDDLTFAKDAQAARIAEQGQKRKRENESASHEAHNDVKGAENGEPRGKDGKTTRKRGIKRQRNDNQPVRRSARNAKCNSMKSGIANGEIE